MKKRNLLFIVLLIPLFLTAGQINFTYTNNISDIVKVNGIWWLATDGGLVKYDRSTGEIKVFNRGNSNIPSNHVKHLTTDENGNIWLSTPYGIGKFDGTTFELFNVQNGALLSNTVKVMDYEVNKGLWVVTDSALSFYNGSSWTRYFQDDEGTSLYLTTALRSASPYGILLAVNGKVKFLNHNGEFGYMGFQTNSMVTGVGYDGMNNLIVTTWGDGVYLGQNDGSFLHYTNGNSPLKTDNIMALEISPQGDLYFNCNQNGFAVLHWDNTWDVFPYQDGTYLSYISTIYAGDNEVALGLGEPFEGFVYAPINNGQYEFPENTTNIQRSPVNSNYVYDVAVSNGKKYIGCLSGPLLYSGEIDVLDENNTRIKKYDGNDLDFLSNHIPALLEVDLFGNIWFAEKYNSASATGAPDIGKISGDNFSIITGPDLGLDVARITALQWIDKKDTYGNITGSMWVSAADNNVYKITYYDSLWNSLPWTPSNPDDPDGFSQMVSDSLGTWFASGGIYSWDWSNQTYTSFWYEAPIKTARSVIRDFDGDVWFGGTGDESLGWPGGIAIYNISNDTWEHITQNNSDLPDNKITCLARDTIGNIWVGTMTGGMVKIDSLGNMTIFNRDNSFLDNNHIKQITVDTTTNDLWIINEGSGVFVYNEQNDIINGVKKPETKRSVAQLKVFPNPFVNETTFDFILSNDENVSLTVYDLTGKKIKEIFHGYLNKGEHRLRFNGDLLPSGYYFCTLKTSRGTISKKFIKAGGSYR